jgi:phosphoglycolate phosphatase
LGDIRRLIVFDLDGTLIDSRRDLASAANALIRERDGRPLPEEAIGRMVGEGASALVQRALTAARLPVLPDSVTRFLELYDERLLETTRVYSGIPDAVATLAAAGVIAVLTNKPAAPSLRILDALGLARHLAATIGGDSEFPKKPDPASLRSLMARFGLRAEETVMIGDSWIDWETARRAGTPICLARYGFGFETFPAAQLRGDEALVDHPAQIVSAVGDLLTAARRDR